MARLEFPQPLEGSSRRRCPVVMEESLAEDSVLSRRCGAAASRSVSLTHLAPCLDWRRLSPEGREGGGCHPPIRHTRGVGLESPTARRSADGICPRGIGPGLCSHSTRDPLWGAVGRTGSVCFLTLIWKCGGPGMCRRGRCKAVGEGAASGYVRTRPTRVW